MTSPGVSLTGFEVKRARIISAHKNIHVIKYWGPNLRVSLSETTASVAQMVDNISSSAGKNTCCAVADSQ